MNHGPAVELGVDKAASRKSRLGIWLFIAYTIFYGVFVAIGVINYEALGAIVLAGLNLAIVYGIGLIVVAIVLGIVYNWRCTKIENEMNKEGEL